LYINNIVIYLPNNLKQIEIMENLDDYIEGTFSKENPANIEELECEEERIYTQAEFDKMETAIREYKARFVFLREKIKRYIEIKNSPFSLTSDEQVELNELSKLFNL